MAHLRLSRVVLIVAAAGFVWVLVAQASAVTGRDINLSDGLRLTSSAGHSVPTQQISPEATAGRPSAAPATRGQLAAAPDLLTLGFFGLGAIVLHAVGRSTRGARMRPSWR